LEDVEDEVVALVIGVVIPPEGRGGKGREDANPWWDGAMPDDEDDDAGTGVTSDGGGIEDILDQSSSAVVPSLSITSATCISWNSANVRLIVGEAIVVYGAGAALGGGEGG
jgi:hypothetical protein